MTLAGRFWGCHILVRIKYKRTIPPLFNLEKAMSDPICECVEQCKKEYSGLKKDELLKKLAELTGKEIDGLEIEYRAHTALGVLAVFCHEKCDPGGEGDDGDSKTSPPEATLELKPPTGNKSSI